MKKKSVNAKFLFNFEGIDWRRILFEKAASLERLLIRSVK